MYIYIYIRSYIFMYIYIYIRSYIYFVLYTYTCMHLVAVAASPMCWLAEILKSQLSSDVLQ